MSSISPVALGVVCGKKESRFGPIFPGKTFDPAKLSCIGGHERRLVTKRLAPDQQVVFANRPANGFHLRTQLACNSCVLFVEGEMVDRTGKKASKEASVRVAAQALRYPIPEFKNRERR